MALGYKVFVQLVSVTSYSDKEMLDLISLAKQNQTICGVDGRYLWIDASG